MCVFTNLLTFLPYSLCSTHHIAIWKSNVSNLAHLGPPWKTLCQHSDSLVEIPGGQALIEFRSGSSTSPYLFNGFKATVQYVHGVEKHKGRPELVKNTTHSASPRFTTITTTTTRATLGIRFTDEEINYGPSWLDEKSKSRGFGFHNGTDELPYDESKPSPQQNGGKNEVDHFSFRVDQSRTSLGKFCILSGSVMNYIPGLDFAYLFEWGSSILVTNDRN